MKLLIDIPDILMKYIVNGKDLSEEQNDEMALAIANGTPLDDVIEKIRAEQEKYSHPLEIERAIEILDNIGKAESEK